MPSSSKHAAEPDSLRVAEDLRMLLSRWVRTTRTQAGTPATAQVETLRLLREAGPATIAALALSRSVKHQSMRLIVEQLALDELVSKRVNDADRRSQVVRITAQGRAFLKRQEHLRTQWIADLLRRPGAPALHEVEAALNTLQTVLDTAQLPAGD